jgi:flavin-dependent dehydrogenase
VVLIERHLFPRPHVGESLVPAVLPLFDVLGVREAVEDAGFLRPARAMVRWAEPAARQQQLAGAGFQVDRGKLDAILLNAARSAGVCVMQPARIASTVRQREKWRCLVHSGMKSLAVVSRLLVDASGRRKWLKGRVRLCGSKTLALYAYWRHGPTVGSETRVEAGDNAWYWGAPLPDGLFNAAVFVDPDDYRRDVRAHGGRDAVYRSLIARSALLAGCVSGAPLGGVQVGDATAYLDEVPASVEAIKVGEAAFAIDPLSSQGVQSALGSSLHAAAVAHTMLVRPHDAELAVDFYRRAVRDRAAYHAQHAAEAYRTAALSRTSAFWQRRAAPCIDPGEEPPVRHPLPAADAVVQLAEGVRIDQVPVMRSDFIVPGRGIRMPGLHQPLSFLGGVEVAPLLETVARPILVSNLLQLWSARLSRGRVVSIFGWLWAAGALQPARTPGGANAEQWHRSACRSSPETRRGTRLRARTSSEAPPQTIAAPPR